MYTNLAVSIYILHFVGTTAGTQPKCGNGGVSDAVTSELGDRQSITLLKTLLQYYGKSFLPGVAYPGVRDNRSAVNTKTGYEKIYLQWAV